jgi:hypothetical protein
VNSCTTECELLRGTNRPCVRFVGSVGYGLAGKVGAVGEERRIVGAAPWGGVGHSHVRMCGEWGHGQHGSEKSGGGGHHLAQTGCGNDAHCF